MISYEVTTTMNALPPQQTLVTHAIWMVRYAPPPTVQVQVSTGGAGVRVGGGGGEGDKLAVTRPRTVSGVSWQTRG